MPWYTRAGQNLLVRVRVQPRASSCGFTAFADGRLKLRLTAPPADGKANRQAAEILARLFAVPKSNVALASGARSRDKTFKVSGIADPGSLPDPEALPGGFDKL